MSDWSEGYVNSIPYTYGYYANLNPHRMITPFLMAGLPVPKVINACELGFGQGVSMVFHATMGKAKWYGTDFNPSHALFAQGLADSANPDSVFISDQGFNEFCARDDLPEFDYIALHGIWSWISPENRQIIVDFVRRKLKVGGVLYISYNTLPGWSGNAPIRHLLKQSAQLLPPTMRQEEIAANALEQTEKILGLSHNLVAKTPSLANKIKELKEHNKSYIVHEYFNKDWNPMYFAEIEELLKEAKLSYACSASYLDDFADILYDDEQRQFMAEIQNASMQQTMKDFILNKQFRCDFWVKGQNRLSSQAAKEEWSKLTVMLTKPKDEVSRTVTAHRSVTILPDIVDYIVSILGDYQAHTMVELIEKSEGKCNFAQLITILAVLISLEEVAIVQEEEHTERVTEQCQRLNLEILKRTSTQGLTIALLTSPVTGNAYVFDNVQQMFLLAHAEGIPQKNWEKFVWSKLSSLGQVLMKDKVALQTEAENLEQLKALKKTFLEFRFDLALRLKIVKS